MEVAIVDPMSDEAQRCLARYFAEIDKRLSADPEVGEYDQKI